MSSDFGDDSGSALVGWAALVASRSGERAARDAAARLAAATRSMRPEPCGGPAGLGGSWARLDLDELGDVPERDALVGALRDRLVADGTRCEVWHRGEGAGDCLLFRAEDAPRVERELADLSRRAGIAARRTGPVDGRPLEERAETARRASEALAAESRARSRAVPVPEKPRQR